MMKSAQKKNYLEVSYDEKLLPKTDYPEQLAGYITENFFHEAGSLLDVGCGRGEYLEAFEKLGLDVTGVDLSPMVSELHPRFEVKKADFENEKLPYLDNTFNFVFSKSVIEHLHRPECLLDECFRILKPGGKALIMCPSWVHTYWGPFYIDHTHVTPFTLPSLKQVLTLSGFKNIKAEHFIQLPLVWKFPFLKHLCNLIALFPLPFRPLYNVNTFEYINKIIRFSNEKMLLAIAEKPK